MKYSFEQYESAVLDALGGLKAPTGYLRTLKGYAGELDSEEGLKRLLITNLPGILVHISGALYESADIGTDMQTVSVYLTVFARSFRSQGDARSGDKGVYNILMDVRDRLHGQKLGLDIRPALLEREEMVFGSASVVIYGAQYELINDNAT